MSHRHDHLLPPISEYEIARSNPETFLQACLAAFWTVVLVGSMFGGAIAAAEREAVDVAAPRFVGAETRP